MKGISAEFGILFTR